jgi:hypothetical protein
MYLVSYVSSYVAKAFARQGCYRALIGSYRRFDTACRSHLQGSISTTLTSTVLDNVTSMSPVHSKCTPHNMHDHISGDPAYSYFRSARCRGHYPYESLSRTLPLRKPVADMTLTKACRGHDPYESHTK